MVYSEGDEVLWIGEECSGNAKWDRAIVVEVNDDLYVIEFDDGERIEVVEHQIELFEG